MQEGKLPLETEDAIIPTSLSLTREERLRVNLNRIQEKSIISTLAKVSLLMFFLLVAYFTGIFAIARASAFVGQAVLPALLFISAIIWIIRENKNREKQAPSKIVSFAAASVTDVLKSNWDNVDYYSRLYVYASPELASQIHDKRKLLNQVLDERKEALGDFVDIEQLELRIQRFSLLPPSVMELTGILRCTQATVPIVILVNVSTPELTLDGIKVIKKALVKKRFAEGVESVSLLSIESRLSSSSEALPTLAATSESESNCVATSESALVPPSLDELIELEKSHKLPEAMPGEVDDA